MARACPIHGGSLSLIEPTFYITTIFMPCYWFTERENRAARIR
jgi:hypothetical protein